MNIGNKYKIESDSMNVILYEKGKTKKGEALWETLGYFANVKNALKFLVDLGVKETHLIDLKTVYAKQDELYRLIDLLVVSSIFKPSVTEGIDTQSGSIRPRKKKGS